jgi:hypothetical protein
VAVSRARDEGLGLVTLEALAWSVRRAGLRSQHPRLYPARAVTARAGRCHDDRPIGVPASEQRVRQLGQGAIAVLRERGSGTAARCTSDGGPIVRARGICARLIWHVLGPPPTRSAHTVAPLHSALLPALKAGAVAV